METNQPTETQQCFQADHCLDRDCQIVIVERHRIAKELHEQMRNSFNPTASAPKVYSKAAIMSIVNTLDCRQGHHIKFEGKENISTHDDITLTGISMPAFIGKYSIAFFLGLMEMYNMSSNDEFHFYKAKSGDNYVLVMTVNKGQENYYYGNLVGLYP